MCVRLEMSSDACTLWFPPCLRPPADFPGVGNMSVRLLSCVIASSIGLAGCSSKPPEPAPAPAPQVETKPENDPTPAAPAKPDPAVVWADLVKQGQTLLDDGKLDE